MLNRSTRFCQITCLVLSGALPTAASAGDHTVAILSQDPGPTAFIEDVRVHVTGTSTLSAIQFTIAPKTGSFTRAISATYSAAYLIARGFWNGQAPDMKVPVFGLYANKTNNVTLAFTFTDADPLQLTDGITTPTYTDSCGVVDHQTIIAQNRQSTDDLSFDLFVLKKFCNHDSPTVLDTDGEVRWIGDSKASAPSSIFYGNNTNLR